MNNFYFLCKIGSGKAAKEQLAAVEKYLGTGNGGGSADPMTVELFRPLPWSTTPSSSRHLLPAISKHDPESRPKKRQTWFFYFLLCFLVFGFSCRPKKRQNCYQICCLLRFIIMPKWANHYRLVLQLYSISGNRVCAEMANFFYRRL